MCFNCLFELLRYDLFHNLIPWFIGICFKILVNFEGLLYFIILNLASSQSSLCSVADYMATNFKNFNYRF